jgi:hypothetical protein
MLPIILVVSWVSGQWFLCSLAPLLVPPVVDSLRHYLHSNAGRRVFGVTITTASVARVEGLAKPARVVAPLLSGGLMLGFMLRFLIQGDTNTLPDEHWDPFAS